MNTVFSFADTHNTHPSVKAIIFDFGGVIGTANRPLVHKEISKALSTSPEQAEKLLAELKLHLRHGGTENTFWEQYTLSTGQKLPLNWPKQFRLIMGSAIREIPGSLPIVKHLIKQGFQVALLSNVQKYKAEVLAKLGYYDYFQPVILSCDIGYSKPETEIFSHLLQRLKLPPEACLFVDNKEENLEAARRAGFDCIHFISSEALITELKKRGIFV